MQVKGDAIVKRPANALPLAVLALLFEKPMHPYEMSSTLKDRRKEDSIRLNYGSLYAVVDSLRKKGLIDARETRRDGNRPQRTIYEITANGEEALSQWLGEMLSQPSPQFTDFEAALSLIGAMPPAEATRLLKARVEALETDSAHFETLRRQTPPQFPRLFMIEGDFQEALRKTETTFVKQLVADIESGDLTGIPLWNRLHEVRAEGGDVQAQLFSEFADELTWSPLEE